MENMRAELIQRNLTAQINRTTPCMNMIKLLKQNKNDKTYFKPLTDYNVFKWNTSHVDTDGKTLELTINYKTWPARGCKSQLL